MAALPRSFRGEAPTAYRKALDDSKNPGNNSLKGVPGDLLGSGPTSDFVAGRGSPPIESPEKTLGQEPESAASELFANKREYHPEVSCREPIKIPSMNVPSKITQTLRSWEGVVVGIGKDKFRAILSDLEDPTAGQESGNFLISETPEDDRPLIKVGSVFYWYVGIEVHRAGAGLRQFSEVKFRRLPAWSTGDLKAVEEEAARLKRLFGQKKDPSISSSQ